MSDEYETTGTSHREQWMTGAYPFLTGPLQSTEVGRELLDVAPVVIDPFAMPRGRTDLVVCGRIGRGL